ncbi:MAG: hypothetical protein ABIP77_03220 [Candidatus Limnocylindrales bacterium]
MVVKFQWRSVESGASSPDASPAGAGAPGGASGRRIVGSALGAFQRNSLSPAAGLVIGIIALALVAVRVPGLDGLVFVASFATYMGIRQLLLRIRAESRRFS